MAGLAVLARIRQARGDRAGALDAIRKAEQVQMSPSIVGLLDPLPTLRARLALADGAVAEAASWARAAGLAAEDAPSYPREREYLVLARLLLAQQAPEQALGLLERWYAPAVTQGRTDSVIELQALRALASAACEDEPAALASLTEALTLAATAGYLRVFLDEGPPMAALFRKLLEQPTAADAVPGDYLIRLLGAFEQHGMPILPPPRAGTVVVPGLPEPLTARELEVLRLLATGQPNRAIAEELTVTLDTVKRHISHLFAKLGVANRTQAVTRAQELGLLP